MKGLFQKLFLALLAVTLFTACATDKYNVSDPKQIEDVNKNNTYVYGEPDSPPRQLGNDPEDTEEAEAASKRIYDKFFVEPYAETEANSEADSTVATEIAEEETTAEADSTQADA